MRILLVNPPLRNLSNRIGVGFHLPLGLLMVGVGLDVPNAGLRDEVVAAMPRLRDAYVRNLVSYSATSVRPWRQPDVAEIADRLQRVTDRLLQRPGARILLAQVAMRLNK